MSPSSFQLVASIAFRSVWRNPRRSMLTIFAIAAGIWACVALSALARGVAQQMFRDAIKNLTGHIQIHAPGYLDDPVSENSMQPLGDDLKALLAEAVVDKWARRIRVPGMITSERKSTGITLVGIEPEKERGLSFISEAVSNGVSLDSALESGIVVGKSLLKKLETQIGKRVVLLASDENNKLVDRAFRIKGVFDAELDATEEQFVFVGLSEAQEFLKLESRISEVALTLENREDLEEFKRRLQALAPDLDIQPWYELEPLVAAAAKLQDGTLYIWFSVVFLAVSFGLVNTLFMTIFERTRELGLLGCLGMKPSMIMLEILYESLLLLFFGVLLGNGLALLNLEYLREGIDLSSFSAGTQMAGIGSIVYPTLLTKDFITANVLIFVLGILGSLYPAFKAGRLAPVEAISRQ